MSRALLPQLPSTVTPGLDEEILFGQAPEEATSRWVVSLGPVPGVRRWVALHRYEPFWMNTWYGTDLTQLPTETQWLLAELESGQVAMFVPLVNEPVRVSLQGGPEGLEMVLETGDSATQVEPIPALLVGQTEDLYGSIQQWSAIAAAYMENATLSCMKNPPAFTEQLGWCTWDAFYQEVSHGKVQEGLEAWKEGGLVPPLLILDDGWQTVADLGEGVGKQLADFAPNDKFPGGLAKTRAMAREYGVHTFLVWHAVTGYWGGASAEMGYRTRTVARDSSPGIQAHEKGHDSWWGRSVSLVEPEDIYRFFQDYHRSLRRQGIDGVKVDVQAQLETIAEGTPGGRVALMRQYREALEGSVAVHFDGNLINCMSCSNEMLYGARASTVTRTSTDFWPNRPETHGKHIQVNSMVSLWFGQFVHPDWDMFQSGHPAAKLHALARAMSGGPVYVSDKPGETNFALLRKLANPEGRLFVTDSASIPAPGSIFVDATKEPVPFFLLGEAGEARMIAALNLLPDRTVSGALTPDLFPPADSDEDPPYAVYAHHAGELRLMEGRAEWPFELDALDGEIFTVLPILEDFVPIGLVDYFIPSAGFTRVDALAVSVEAGRFVAWCQRKPRALRLNGKSVPIRYSKQRLDVTITGEGSPVLEIEF